MKSYKPYLSLSKASSHYELGVVLNCSQDQTIASIEQQEISTETKKYWGVVVTLSTGTQLMNGPENPIFSSTVPIALDKSKSYKTIKCVVQQKVKEGEYGPAQDEETDIDFGDGN